MQGTGSYDNFAIEWGYNQGAPGRNAEQERARLDAIVRKALAAGVTWGNYADPRWNAYDDSADPVEWLNQVWPVRDALLTRYGANLLRPGEPGSLLASRFPLIYLFHRYALGAAVNVIGSAKIPPTLVGDGQEPISVWSAASQREALNLVLRALDPKELEVPAALWKMLAPPEPDRDDAERFNSSAGYLFSPQDGARAVAEIVVGGLLDSQRMQRLLVIRHESDDGITPGEIVGAMVKTAFAESATLAGRAQDLANPVQAQVAERLMLLSANADATSEVQAAALAGVLDVQKLVKARNDAAARRLSREIELFLSNPQQNAPKLKPSGAPPGPPV
jgi:hypothetical protein